MSQQPLRERVANERRRLKSVRTALTVAVAQGAKGDAGWVPFYAAIADYFDASMHRLHIQDVRMGTMIRSKIGTIDAAAARGLEELDARLAGNQRHLGLMLEARDALRRDGVAALGRFETVARDYTHYITTNMGHHGPSTDLAQRLFTIDDWSYMAGITDEESRTEDTLYQRVFAARPANLQLPD
ncbi:MAG: hypothetical protein FJ197_03045 [Gammaproteobacteria bacterium]|nr:hypothetical protein [Gammaproteobacteria bacterium]